MSEFISSDEAKLAWAEGVDVQVATGPDKFRTLVSSDNLGIFFPGNYFRLKPRTITLSGIEVPGVKYVAHSGGNCVKISCECPEDAAAIGAALRSIFNPQ